MRNLAIFHGSDAAGRFGGGMPASLRAFAPAFAWAVGIWLIGGMDSVSGAPAVPGLDKLAHFCMYGVLGLLAGRGWAAAGTREGRVWPILAVLALGAVDEYRQSYAPGRSASVADWVADAAGAGVGFFLVLRRTRGQRDDEVSDEQH